MLKVFFIGISAAVIVFAVIVTSTGIAGDHATFGKCLTSASGERGFSRSTTNTYDQSEYDCKVGCVWMHQNPMTEGQDIMCEFETISRYAWKSNPVDFDDFNELDRSLKMTFHP
ncbi:MAG: hypothetical protein GKS07_08310 [Nitrosopumilus sp.]|nr:MAG: hypothetical protein GKS07_08310 [Nitrosopumilus sp.]